MKKVGIMGGTFNPIHIAHLILAEKAYEQFDLDEIVFLPSRCPVHKVLQEVIKEQYRQDMIELAIKDNPHFTIDTMEFEREGNTYTSDTLLQLTKANPEIEYYFILGGDSLFQMETWNRPEIVFAKAHILAAQREDKTDEAILDKMEEFQKKYNADIRLLRVPQIDISSNMIRKLIREGKSVRYYIPKSVLDYIVANGLYRDDTDKAILKKEV